MTASPLQAPSPTSTAAAVLAAAAGTATNATTKVPDRDKLLRVARADTYPKYAWYCVAALLALLSLCHYAALAVRLLLSPSAPRPGLFRSCRDHDRERGQSMMTPPRRPVDVRRLPAACTSAWKAIAFRWTIPLGKSYTLNLAEVVLTAAYIVLIFTLSFISTTSQKGQRYDPRYWANRAGNIASAQLVLTTALGMKNNIISALTGVGPEKLNYLHRMTARVLCVLFWVHGGGRMKMGLKGTTSWSHPWIQCGLLSVTALSVLSAVCIRPLRNLGYEAFLIMHFLLVFITLLAGYFHAAELKTGSYIWPSLFLWALDRFLRLLRLLITNVPPRFGCMLFRQSTSRRGITAATAPDADARVEVLSPYALRVTLCPASHVRWRPGQWAYLSFPGVATASSAVVAWAVLPLRLVARVPLPLEAHPFTIASVGSWPAPGTAPMPGRDAEKEGTLKRRDDAGQSVDARRSLVFLVRVRDGFTRRLFHAAERRAQAIDRAGAVQMKALVDGPYGNPPVLRGYASVLLVAGGSGISFTLPLLQSLVFRARKGKSDCVKVVFVWVIRDAGHLEWVADTFLQALQLAPVSMQFEIMVHVTAPVTASASSDLSPALDECGYADDLNTPVTATVSGEEEGEEKGEEKEGKRGNKGKDAGMGSSACMAVLASPAVQVLQGRPDLDALVRAEIGSAVGDVSINACGPPGLVHAVRSVLREPRFVDMLRGGPAVSLHVEPFGM